MFMHVSVLKVDLADKSWMLSSYTWFCDWFSQAEHTSRAHLCCIKAAFDLLGSQRSYAVMQSHREVMRDVMMLLMIALERCSAWNRILIPFWIKIWSRSFPMTSILAYWHLLPLTVLKNYRVWQYDLWLHHQTSNALLYRFKQKYCCRESQRCWGIQSLYWTHGLWMAIKN